MQPPTLLADPTAIRLEKVIQHDSSLTLVVRVTRAEAEYPRCHRPSSRVHSYYTRSIADLPWHGVAVRLDLRTRRLRCQNSLCTKRVFCERLPGVVARYGRKTVRLEEALTPIGLLLGGEAGSRATLKLAMATSADTLLRRVRAALEYEWSNGQTEGQVHRLELIKRQMYGRGKPDLLRARVLYAA